MLHGKDAIVVIMTTRSQEAAELVPATEANRRFSALLRGVLEGKKYIVTSHGRPIAQIGPATPPTLHQEAARSELLSRLEQQPAITAEAWRRADLYDDQ